MINIISTLLADYFGLIRVCGFKVANKWLVKILSNIKLCLKEKNLQPADKSMGQGPFSTRRKNARANLFGDQVISGIREIWVRDVYLKNDFLTIPENGLIVDLGANMGNFTCLALAHGNSNRVIAIEPNLSSNAQFWKQIEINNWRKRVTLRRVFIGGKSSKQDHLLQQKDYEVSEFISQSEFLTKNNISNIDFLKCDIEGSEFELISEGNSLFKITDQLAIEIHDFAGNRIEFINNLKSFGFTIGPIKDASDSCILLARK